MIDRSYGKLVFECDSCPEVLETDTADFSEAWEQARADGWKSKKRWASIGCTAAQGAGYRCD